MTSVIYFKLKNAIQQQLVNFDGSVIQIGDIKRLIATKQGLGPDGALELTLFDSNTGVEYSDDGKVIPRNTLVLVKRTPAAKFKPLVAGETGTAAAAAQPTTSMDPFGEAPAADAAGGNNEFGGDFYSEQPTAAVVNEDESKAMQSFLQGTASTWQREVRQGVMRGRGRGRGGRGGAAGGGVAPEYKCPRCDAIGVHWLQDCPTQGDPAYDRKRFRPPVGIPMTRLARSQEGGLVLPDGQTGTLVANEDSFAREILGLGLMPPPPPSTQDMTSASQQQQTQQQEPVLALDNKPANTTSNNTISQTIGNNLVQPLPQSMIPPHSIPASALGSAPKLAGEEDILGPSGGAGTAAAMPGAHLFDIYMRAALLPRGPPRFLEKAYGGADPLSRSEFERYQDDYRRRYNLPPIRRSRRSRSRSPSRRRRSSRERERERGSRSSRPSRSRSRSRTRDRSRDKDYDRSKRSSSSRRERERSSDHRRNRDRSSREKEREKDSKRDRDKDRSEKDRDRKSTKDKERSVSRSENHKKKESKTPSMSPQLEIEDEAANNGDMKEAAAAAAAAAAPAPASKGGGVSASPTLDINHEPELDYDSSDPEDEPAAPQVLKKTKPDADGDKAKANGSKKPIVWPGDEKDKKKESSDRQRRVDDRKKDDKRSSRRDRDRDKDKDRTLKNPKDREKPSSRGERGSKEKKEKERSMRRERSRERKRGRSAERNGKDNNKYARDSGGGGNKRERRSRE